MDKINLLIDNVLIMSSIAITISNTTNITIQKIKYLSSTTLPTIESYKDYEAYMTIIDNNNTSCRMSIESTANLYNEIYKILEKENYLSNIEIISKLDPVKKIIEDGRLVYLEATHIKNDLLEITQKLYNMANVQ